MAGGLADGNAGRGNVVKAGSWFVAGQTDPLMAARGLAAGSVVIAAGAAFMPPWAAVILGGAIGLVTVLAIFVVDHLLRWDDSTAALTVHGLAGALGLLAVGVFGVENRESA